MIEHQLVLIIALILAICVLIMVSQRIKVAYPIMLVLGGVAMSFIPGMPRFNINPDLIFLVFFAAYTVRSGVLQLVERTVAMAQDNRFVCLYCGVYHGPCCGIYSQHLYSGFLGGLRFFVGWHCFAPRCRVGSHHYEICKGAKAYIGHSGRREFVQRCQFAHHR